MLVGVVKFFNEEKGFGFIKPETGGGDVFVHVSQLRQSGIAILLEGQRVSFELGESRGKHQAQNLSVLGDAPTKTSESDLVQMARVRANSTPHDPATLREWNKVLSYIKHGTPEYSLEVEVYSYNGRPQFPGEWGRFNAWCKLVGLKPVWSDSTAKTKVGGVWTSYWSLEMEHQGLPGPYLKRKLIEDHGVPPGY
ncbi:cold-shock protein [Rhizobium laguerreae]|nr:cold-shock protein [Rhizobium laguerreae]